MCQPKFPPLTIKRNFLLTAIIYKSNNIRLCIAMKLALTQMESGNSLFVHTCGAMIWGSCAEKLVMVHPYGDNLSYFNGYMEINECHLWQLTNNKPSHRAWPMVFIESVWSMKLLMVKWDSMYGWSSSSISGTYEEKWYVTVKIFYLTSITTTTMPITLILWSLNSYSNSFWIKETEKW